MGRGQLRLPLSRRGVGRWRSRERGGLCAAPLRLRVRSCWEAAERLGEDLRHGAEVRAGPHGGRRGLHLVLQGAKTGELRARAGGRHALRPPSLCSKCANNISVTSSTRYKSVFWHSASWHTPATDNQHGQT